MATIDFFHTIRGHEVQVFASDFDGDPTVGLPYGPECVWAELDGQPFELTEAEEAEMGVIATEIVLDDPYDPAEWYRDP